MADCKWCRVLQYFWIAKTHFLKPSLTFSEP